MAVRFDRRSLRNPYAELSPGGRLMFFGRPTLMWEDAPPPEEYYKSFGFSEVHSIDISQKDGCTFVHDLNYAEIPGDLIGKYRAVNTGGTMEHVFNVFSALQVGAKLLEVGGSFYCDAPVNNWIDHGFWQISPTLKFDYFGQNDFDFGVSNASIDIPERGFRRMVPSYPGESFILNYIPARIGHTLQAIKTSRSTFDRMPIQNLYMRNDTGAAKGLRFRAFAPFDVIENEEFFAPMRSFRLDNIKEKQGCFASLFREEGFLPSVPRRPFRSKALVYEDGVLLPWIVSDALMVAERSGSFTHQGAFIYFSSSDGSDPRENGRVYEVAFPQPFKGIQPYAVDPNFTRG